jgi:hypothetical protein
MSQMNPCSLVVAAIALSVVVGGDASAQDPGAVQTRVAALKQALQDNQAQLRKYEWVETTIVNLKGEEKDRKQERAYYGVDGKVQKVLLDEEKAAAPEGGRGGRLKQRVVAKKTGEMKDYMEAAAALIHQYVPPNPADIDSARKREKVAVKPGQGGVVRLELTDYIKPGDLLAVDLDAAANRLIGISVNTYLDTPDDAVTLNVGFATLPDGTSYTAQTTFDAKAKNVTVVVQKSGYRPAGR